MQDTDSSRLAVQITDALGSAFTQRDVAPIRAFYDEDIQVWHHYDGTVQGKAENLAFLEGTISAFATLEYRDIRRVLTTNGIVQQHILVGKLPDGRSMEIPCCLILEIKDGLIVRLDEYLNPAPAAALMSR